MSLKYRKKEIKDEVDKHQEDKHKINIKVS